MMYTVRPAGDWPGWELERWDTDRDSRMRELYQDFHGEAAPTTLQVLDPNAAVFTLVTDPQLGGDLHSERVAPAAAWEALHDVFDLDANEHGWTMVTSGNQYACLLHLPEDQALAWAKAHMIWN